MVGTLSTAIAAPEVAACGGLAVEVVTEYGAFLDLEAEWNEAVERAAILHPFLRHEWVRTWWDSFGAGARLHMLVVREGDRILAIAPLMRESALMYGVPVQRLRFLANDHTPRTDILIVERPDDSYRAIWHALVNETERWDVLQLSHLPPGSPTLDRVSTLAAASRLSTGVWNGESSPYLSLAGTWDTYWASLSAKFRSNIRNRTSRLTKLGEPALEMLSDRTAIEGGGEDAWRLEASGWKREAGTAIASNPAVHRFYTLLTERATEHGWLRLMFLTAGGKRIATSYGACYEKRLFLFKTGYDPEYAACAPFKLLTHAAIRHAYAEGLAELDFLGQDEPWKLEWTETRRSHTWLFIFSDSRRARFLHSLKFQVVPELRRWRA